MTTHVPLELERIARRHFLQTTLTGLGVGICWGKNGLANPTAEQSRQSPIGQRELLKGLDGMSHSVIRGRNPFVDGHNAAAVIASTFFCQEQRIGTKTQQALLEFMKEHLFPSPIYQTQPNEEADPSHLDGLVEDLHAGIHQLRRSGHNIIFATLSLKALRTVPQAATPQRIEGLRKMVRSFRTPDRGVAIPDDGNLVDLSDEKAFIRFIFKEYLDALELYRNGKGHHGFAGHMLTVGHALLELSRLGYPKTARQGITAMWEFVGEARKGADRGGQRVPDGPQNAPAPLDPDYWLRVEELDPSQIVSSHLIKYPYSFYALAQELDDMDLKTRALSELFHLSAIS